MLSDVEADVRQIMETVLSRPVGPGENPSRATEPSWDSLRHVELLLAVEGACGVHFDGDEMAKLDSFETLVRSVKRHRAS